MILLLVFGYHRRGRGRSFTATMSEKGKRFLKEAGPAEVKQVLRSRGPTKVGNWLVTRSAR